MKILQYFIVSAICVIFVDMLLSVQTQAKERTIVFQNGFNGYNGTSETIIKGNPSSEEIMNFGGEDEMIISGVPWGGWEDMGLIRFKNIIGNSTNQIPVNADIVSAQLLLYKTADQPTDAGQYKNDYIDAFMMISPWKAGTQQDKPQKGASCFLYRIYSPELSEYWGNKNENEKGPVRNVDYSIKEYATAPLVPKKTNTWISWNVTQIVKKWVKGGKNYGFYLVSSGFWVGAQVISSKFENQTLRPKLVVTFKDTSYAKTGGTLDLIAPVKMPPTIVISVNATASEQFAAQQLSEYLKRITGQKVPIITDNNTNSVKSIIIAVGKNKLTESIFKNAHLGVEQFIIDVKPDMLIIVGGMKPPITNSNGQVFVRDRGTLYGVYHFLERLGVRWYRPESWGTYIPKEKKIVLKLGETKESPGFAWRWGINDYQWWQHETLYQRQRTHLWAVRNGENVDLWTGPKLGGYRYISFDQDISRFVPASQYYAKHPEYFALIDGKRNNSPYNQLSFPNPNVQRLVAQGIIAEAKSNPEVEVLSISPNDGSMWSQGKKSMSWDNPHQLTPWSTVSMSNRVFRFDNIIAKMVAKKYHDVKLGTLAYYDTAEPPTLVKKIQSNIVVQLSPYGSAYSDYSRPLYDLHSVQNHRFLKALLGWIKILGNPKRLSTYEYWSGYDWYGPLPVIQTMVDRLRAYHNLGLAGVYNQAGGNTSWGPQGLDYYMFTKLMWNPNMNVKKELNLYYHNYFGPAAAAMKNYYQTMENAAQKGPYFGSGGYDVWNLFTPELLNKMGMYMTEAKKLVAGKPLYEKRFEGVWAGYEFDKKYQKIHKLINENKLPEAGKKAKELINFVESFKDGWVFDNGVNPDAEPLGHLKYEFKKIIQLQSYESVFQNPKVLQVLNTGWYFKTDPQNIGLKNGWEKSNYSLKGWAILNATEHYNSQGYPNYYGISFYRHAFRSPIVKVDEHIILFFGAVDGDATIYINDKKIGFHAGNNANGWDKPFWFDITDFVKKGDNDINWLAVRVKKTSFLGGIWKGVQIMKVSGIRETTK
ncbi:MAG: DUF4838 domain-containing protein [Candidatus Omnitrophica bacterium]|nr:DUF4838 domain-containing protein [Candidatus Omnitrophota bacterium]